MKYKSLEECLKNYCGRNTKINTCFPVGGGDINEAFCLLLSNDEKVFVKTNRAERLGFFEADLAMTELFGGFREDFYRGYNEVNPVGAGYKDRKDIYNLYHLLNHLNLFGPAYLSGVLRIVNHYV